MFNFQQQKGISLVELMISITIGLILMTGVVQLFLSSRATFSTQQALARVQESGRLAIDFLSGDIRMAGFTGCGSRRTQLKTTLNDKALLSYKFDVAVEGVDDVTGNPPAGYPDTALEGTDILVVRSASGSSLGIKEMNDENYVYARYTSDAAPCGPEQTGSSGICSGDILVVANCNAARVFQATEIVGNESTGEVRIAHAAGENPGNEITTWGGGDDPSSDESFGQDDSQILQMITTVYYIAEGTSGQPSLWQEVNGLDRQELLEGVQDMQLEYGLDSNGDGTLDSYRDADDLSVTEWSRVFSVRVNLLVQSTEDNVLPDPQPYTFHGETVDDPGDRRLRHVFSSTVGIRSRVY